MNSNPPIKSMKAVATAQGGYYAVTGIWPLVHYVSFESITGPKEDVWLVQTMGLGICAFGLVLILLRNRLDRSSMLLSLSFALALALADGWFFAKGIIGFAYMLDALVQSAFVVAWCVLLFRRYTRTHSSSRL